MLNNNSIQILYGYLKSQFELQTLCTKNSIAVKHYTKKLHEVVRSKKITIIFKDIGYFGNDSVIKFLKSVLIVAINFV